MGKLNGLRIIEIPDFRAVTSGSKITGKIFAGGGFNQWMQAHLELARMSVYGHAYDFMWHEQEGYATYIWAIKDDVTADNCIPYEIIEFKGGLYAAAAFDDRDEKDRQTVTNEMIEWVKNNSALEIDSPPRYCMEHTIGISLTDLIGVLQQEIFLPIKAAKNPKRKK